MILVANTTTVNTKASLSDYHLKTVSETPGGRFDHAPINHNFGHPYVKIAIFLCLAYLLSDDMQLRLAVQIS